MKKSIQVIKLVILGHDGSMAGMGNQHTDLGEPSRTKT